MLDNIKHNKKGIALVMSLMILSVAMLTGLFMNSIIVGELRVSLNTINVVNSYYAAESGIEKALYYLTSSQLEDNIDYYDSLDLPANPANNHSLANGAEYSFELSDIKAPNFAASNISNTNPAHVSILDPRGEIGSIGWSTDDNITGLVKWRIDNCFPNHASDRLEITRYYFNNNFSNPDVQKIVSVCDCTSDIDTLDSCSVINLAGLSKNNFHRLVFRPLDSHVDFLDFSLSGSNQILSESLTKVKGKYKNSEYLLQAQISTLSPVSDIFSYVIFSEEDLTKE